MNVAGVEIDFAQWELRGTSLVRLTVAVSENPGGVEVVFADLTLGEVRTPHYPRPHSEFPEPPDVRS